jgi:hypothetical protein
VSGRRAFPIVGLLAIALVTALAVVGVATYDGGGDAPSPRSPTTVPDGDLLEGELPATDALEGDGIDVRATLGPSVVLFGDSVEAHVDVLVDRSRVDPDSVRVATQFIPWETIGTPERARRDADSVTHLRTTFRLRCLTGSCLFPGQAAQVEFPRARVLFQRAGVVDGERQLIRADWPVLTVYSRLASSSFQGRAETGVPWRADLVALPQVSPRVPPGLLLAILVTGALLLAVAGAALLYRARPRYEAPIVVEPEPEPPPPPIAPLLQALALLEDAAHPDGAEDRRRSLELVSEALEEYGDLELARAARTLAWSEGTPDVEDTASLATRVRATLAVEQLVQEAESGEHRNGNHDAP